MLINILFIMLFAFLGTIIRYMLCKLPTFLVFDGLLLSNILGIFIAIIFFLDFPLFVSAFCGSTTSFSSFIKNGYNYKNSSYVLIHMFIYITFSFFIFSTLGA